MSYSVGRNTDKSSSKSLRQWGRWAAGATVGLLFISVSASKEKRAVARAVQGCRGQLVGGEGQGLSLIPICSKPGLGFSSWIQMGGNSAFLEKVGLPRGCRHASMISRAPSKNQKALHVKESDSCYCQRKPLSFLHSLQAICIKNIRKVACWEIPEMIRCKWVVLIPGSVGNLNLFEWMQKSSTAGFLQTELEELVWEG